MLIRHVACGSHHTALLTATGHLYTMGLNNYGQLGIEPKPSESSKDFQGTFSKKGCEPVCKSKNLWAPCLVESLKHLHVLKVECGANFTMVQAKTRKSTSKKTVLYAWGDNQYGQLGLSQCTPEEPPKKHKNKKPSLSEMVRHSAIPNILNSTHVPEP